METKGSIVEKSKDWIYSELEIKPNHLWVASLWSWRTSPPHTQRHRCTAGGHKSDSFESKSDFVQYDLIFTLVRDIIYTNEDEAELKWQNQWWALVASASLLLIPQTICHELTHCNHFDHTTLALSLFCIKSIHRKVKVIITFMPARRLFDISVFT